MTATIRVKFLGEERELHSHDPGVFEMLIDGHVFRLYSEGILPGGGHYWRSNFAHYYRDGMSEQRATDNLEHALVGLANTLAPLITCDCGRRLGRGLCGVCDNDE